MDRETIYLDNDEEITTLVDKLKKTDFVTLDLVVPKDALILQSVVNLKLLKRQAESLGKEITLVTQDKVGRKLAEQIGIPVVEKPGQVPKEVRMTEAEEEENIEEAVEDEMIEFKKASKKPKKTVVEEDDEDDIEFKSAPSVLEPTKEVVGEEEKPEQPEPKLPSKKKKLDFKKKALIGGFAALAIFVAAYIYLPMANVTVKLASESKKVDFTFTADKNADEVSTSEQTIPAQEINVEKEVNQKFPATGKKKTGTKATGSVTVVNRNYSTSDFTINAGSRIVTTSGLVFRTTTNVTVPKYTKPPQVDGTISVNVQADAVGESYNVSGGTMSIPGLSTNTADIYATGGNFTGGTSKDVQYVTQTDVNTAKTEIEKTVERELMEEAIKKSDRDQRIVEKSYKIEQISAAASPDVNGEGAEFELKVKAKIKALAFREGDLTKLAENVLGDQIGSTKEIVEKNSLTEAAEFIEGDFDKGTVKIRVTGKAYIATKLDQDKLKVDLSGESNAKALEYLKDIDGINDAEVSRQFPSFYKRLPRLKNHIYLKIEIDKSE